MLQDLVFGMQHVVAKLQAHAAELWDSRWSRSCKQAGVQVQAWSPQQDSGWQCTAGAVRDDRAPEQEGFSALPPFAITHTPG
jgi:hypothetical protein